MGYLTTAIAAAAVNATNLQPARELPNISVLDLLLPRRLGRLELAVSPKQKEQPAPEEKTAGKSSITYHTVTKDRQGRKCIVAHRSDSDSKKRDNKTSGGDGAASGNAGADNKKSDQAFTAAEDALLLKLKAKNTSWKNISEEMKRNQGQLKARFKEVDKGGGETNNNGEAKKGGGEPNNDAEVKKGEGDKGKEKANKGKGKGKNKKQRKFSAEDDALLKELVSKDAPWQDIARQLKCSPDLLRARLKEIDPKAASKATSKDEKKDNKDPNGATKQEPRKGKPDGQAKATEHKRQKEAPKKPASNPPDSTSEVRFTMNEWRTLQEDEMFSFAELQLLSELVMQDQDQTWIRIASRFFDKTGRRVHPHDIRDKFEQLARLA